MLNKLTIKFQLIGVAVMTVVIILLLVGMNVYSIRHGTSALAEVYENNVQPLTLLQEMDAVFKEVRFRLVAVPLDQVSIKGSGDHLKEARARVPQIWAEFKRKVAKAQITDQDRELIAKIDKQIAAIDPFFEKLDKIYAAGNKDALMAPLQEEWPLINRKLLKPIGQLIPAQEAAVKQTYEKNLALGKKLTTLSLIVGGVNLVLLLAFVIRLVTMLNHNIGTLNQVLRDVAQGDLGVKARIPQQDEFGSMADSINQTVDQLRHIISGVKHAADNVASSSADLSQETDRVTQRADAQADRVMQVSAAMEQMSVSVTEISTGAHNVVDASTQTQSIVDEGKGNMAKSMEATRRIVDTVESSSTVITELSHAIGKINEITKVIKDIADQTNLLALNAAIEAARAGEQGRGFAVVADEVRKLAERTALSTADISNMVETISSKTVTSVRSMETVKREVENGASYSNATNNTLSQVIEAAVRVTTLAHQIASATNEQSKASEESARNMEEISSLTEENAASIHHVKQAADTLSGTAGELQRLVGQFKLNS
ncbi:MAG: methyl-accepting chemotaxis protein [Hydrogenophilales bacterium]|nr:methyl-accepting chemotaxis protein [Hydrogenophilales bacterium]